VEDRTDELCVRVWQRLGESTTGTFLSLIEPVGDVYVARIDATAGENWMPAARPRRR
jgi:hypothetical protein